MQKCIWYSPSSFCFDGETPSFLIRFTTKNRKFRASKKPTVGFFVQDTANVFVCTSFIFLFSIEKMQKS